MITRNESKIRIEELSSSHINENLAWCAIDEIFDQFEATIQAQEIIIKELELRLSLSSSALEEYKQEVKAMEAMAQPKTCEGCKWHKVTSYNPDSKCELCARGLNDFYEPKAQP